MGWIVVNHQTGLRDGVYRDIGFAEKSKANLKKLYPNLDWEVLATEICGFNDDLFWANHRQSLESLNYIKGKSKEAKE